MLMNLFILWILMSLFCGSQTAGRTVRFLLGIVVFFWVVRILACFGLITAKRSDGRIFHLSYDRFCKGKNLGTREDRRDVHIGKRYQLHNGVWVTIIGNNGSNDVAVQTDTGYVKRHLRLQNVITGRVRIPKEYLFPDADG